MTSKTKRTLQSGRPYPLGVDWDGEGANVAVFFEHERHGMTSKTKRTLQAGRPYPLGVDWDGEGANVAVFSEHEAAA